MSPKTYTTTCPCKIELITKYPQVFHGIGKLNNFQLHLPIDESVTLVAQAPRRILFHIGKAIQAKLRDARSTTFIYMVLSIIYTDHKSLEIIYNTKCKPLLGLNAWPSDYNPTVSKPTYSWPRKPC